MIILNVSVPLDGIRVLRLELLGKGKLLDYLVIVTL